VSGDGHGVPSPGDSRERAEAARDVPADFGGGRYVVRRHLGEGGEKIVYLGHDVRIDRPVAIALIKTRGLGADVLARVRREASAMGRLGNHPHIVSIHDIGDEDGRPFLVLEYMAGGDLAERLDRAPSKRLPVAEAVRVAEQVCRALDYAHRHGIVHRDVKPGNVWLTDDGTAKLGDFGLAVSLDLQRLTAAGTILGTVCYMAPEQALGRETNARTDLYGLGAMLYEMVSGRPPFVGDDAVAIMAQHINTPPVAPSWHNADVPRALETLVLELLAKTPEERPASAAAVRERLATIATAPFAVAERAARYDANPLDRLARGIFVGREREKNVLRGALEEALAGQGQLVQLAGEPGIGKTRIAEEIAVYARLRKAEVLWGRCYEGEGAPTFWPWVQIIRAHFKDRESQVLLGEMGAGAVDIAQLASIVRERFPDLPALPPLEPEQARFRLFDAITTFLRRASTNQPLVIVLDDLHFADRPSLLLLEFLARELDGSRLLVIGTYRDAEVRRHNPLAQTLGELVRAHRSKRVLLRGLGEQDVARFIELTTGTVAPSPLASAVYRETEGNPFFVSEIVNLLVSEGRIQRAEQVKSWSVEIPQSVREVIGKRLDRLSDDCNRMLTVAAVVGREFGIDTLERVGEVSGDRLLEVLDEAASARVVREVAGAAGRYSFAHALIRETLYDELSTIRRLRLHRRIGEALEALYVAKHEPHLSELAYHFLAAAQPGNIGKAIDYARRAAEYAIRRLAYEEGARLYEMALQVLEPGEPVDDRERGDLLLALGDAHLKGGDIERARDAFRRAAEVGRAVGATEVLAAAALGFARWRAGRFDQEEVSLLEEALAALGPEDGTPRARLLARLAVALYYAGTPERRASLSKDGVEMARRLGNAETLAYALNCRCWALWGSENTEERLADASEMLAHAQAVGNPELALEARQWRLLSFLELGDIPAVDAEMREHARLANELRQPQYLWFAALWRAMRALLDGRFEDAERLAGEALALGERVRTENSSGAYGGQMNSSGAYGGQMTFVRREEGRLAELVPWVQETMKQMPGQLVVRCGLASFHADLGQGEDARREFEEVAAYGFAALPRDIYWLISLAHLADACAFLKDAPRAAALYELLVPYSGRNVVMGPGVACFGSADRLLGILAATGKRWAVAEQHFQTALVFNARIGASAWLAHTQAQLAAMLVERDAEGDRTRAQRLLIDALQTAQRLGMKALLERGTALRLRAQGTPATARSSIDALATFVQSEQPDLRRYVGVDGTVTIMFTDIEDFTVLTERLGDARAHAVVAEHNAIVRAAVASEGGVEASVQGDGFMLVFRSARRALRAAVAIQRAITAWGAEQLDAPIRVRVGIHTGEPIHEARDLFGKAVIIAARIASHARGGEIVVSARVKELAEESGEFRFGTGRAATLKGLAGTYEVFEITW